MISGVRIPALRAIVAAMVGLSGCATYETAAVEPTPLGDGVYMLPVDPGGGTRVGPHSAAYQRAIRFCFDQGRQVLRLNGQGGAVAQAGAGMQFRCIGPGEPGWKQPAG